MMEISSSILGSALVTGAGKRIGYAIARDLAAHGWAIALHYSASGGGAEELVAEITGNGGKAVALQADFADPDAVDGLVPRAAEAIGPLTLLVNSAAIFDRDEIGNITADTWQRNIDINLRAPVFLAQAFANQRPPEAKANIINMLDQRVLSPTPYFTSYTASKMAMHGLTKAWALSLAPDIRVNGIGPGFTLPTPAQTDEEFEASKRLQPLQRGTSPQEIADAVRFVVDAPAMTGQMIALDGGQHLAWAHLKADGPWRADAVGTRRIFVRDLRLKALIGVLDHEREAPQDLVVTIALEVDDQPVRHDDIAEVIDYRRPVAHAHAILEAGHIDLVETFADRLADACLTESGVVAAHIRVEKPAAIAEATAAGVEIRRTRESGSWSGSR